MIAVDVIVVGLTGGIGAGKSTVSTMLAERGAVIVDADEIVRELQAPGAPLLDELAARFGDRIIDRRRRRSTGPRSRRSCSTTRSALADLNAHRPPGDAGRDRHARSTPEADTDDVVVLDIPLLTETATRRPGGR